MALVKENDQCKLFQRIGMQFKSILIRIKRLSLIDMHDKAL